MKLRNIFLAAAGIAGTAVTMKMLTRAASVDWEDAVGSIPHSERSRFVSVDGSRIHFQEFGDPSGRKLILIHGYTSSLYTWNTVAPALAQQGLHVIALDLLGFGYSDKPAWFDYSIASQARMVARFMNRIGVGRATLAGNSYGGAIAATIALDYPERVEKLVLVDAVIDDEVLSHPILKLSRVPGLGEAITPFLADSRRFMRRRMRLTLAPANHRLITKERVASIVRPLKARDAHRALLATSRNWDAVRVEQDAPLINQPTLIIWGEDDTVVSIANGYKLHNSILNSRFVVLKNCGHVPAEERPEIFVELVTKFCRDGKGGIEAGDGTPHRIGN